MRRGRSQVSVAIQGAGSCSMAVIEVGLLDNLDVGHLISYLMSPSYLSAAVSYRQLTPYLIVSTP